jgi:TnpA family transposase
MTKIKEREEAEKRVAEIDAMFEQATGWGSWTVSAANEREFLANVHGFEHKYQARTASGGRTD